MDLAAVGNNALVEIARMAYGSGAFFEGENGGRGNIGAIRRPDGTLRVIKFDTHGTKGSSDPVAKQRAANELRIQLISIAMNKGLDPAVLNEIRAQLKLPPDSNDTKNIKDPLSRKTVAAVAKIIDKDIWVKAAKDFDMSSLNSKQVADMGYDDVLRRIPESDDIATGVSKGIKDSKFFAQLRKEFDFQVNILKTKYRVCYAKPLSSDIIGKLETQFDEVTGALLEHPEQAALVKIDLIVETCIKNGFQDAKMDEEFSEKLAKLADISDKKKEKFFLDVGMKLYEDFNRGNLLNVVRADISVESIVAICENVHRNTWAGVYEIMESLKAQDKVVGEEELRRMYQAFWACLRICNPDFDKYVRRLDFAVMNDAADSASTMINNSIDAKDNAEAEYDGLKESDPEEKERGTKDAKKTFEDCEMRVKESARVYRVVWSLMTSLRIKPRTAVVKGN